MNKETAITSVPSDSISAIKKPVVVIYHKADFDGLFCREIARKALGEKAEYIGWDYGDPEPVVTPEQTLYILDLSVPGLMNHPNLIWIDHHKTAIEKYPQTIRGYRINGVAACRLTQQWFLKLSRESLGMIWLLPDKTQFVERLVSEPHAVRLAGEYDIWDKRDPDAETFQFGLLSVRSDVLDGYWAALLAENRDGEYADGCHVLTMLLNRGAISQVYQRNTDTPIVRDRAFEMQWEGLNFLCLNTARCNSLTFASRVNATHDGLLGFFWSGDKWKVSLYSTPSQFGKDIDLSAIAAKYGGGGHRGACGFESARLPWEGPYIENLDSDGKRERLFYYEDGITAWTPVPDLVQDLCDWTCFEEGEEIQIEFRKKKMTDAEFDAIPEV